LITKTESIQLFTGDIVVFPFGVSHLLAHKNDIPTLNGKEVVQLILSGKSLFAGDNLSTILMCGHFDFDKNLDHPFIKELPSIIHIKDADLKQFPWLKNIADLVIEEAGKEKVGSNIIVNKLGEILFIHTLSALIEKNRSPKGFIAAIQDPRISKVLKAIHFSLEKN